MSGTRFERLECRCRWATWPASSRERDIASDFGCATALFVPVSVPGPRFLPSWLDAGCRALSSPLGLNIVPGARSHRCGVTNYFDVTQLSHDQNQMEMCCDSFRAQRRKLLPVVDHSARWSRKNAASCVNRCEMQDTPSTRHSNAHCSLGIALGFVCLSVVYKPKPMQRPVSC